VDGRRAFDRQPGLVFVGNIPEYGTGFPIVPQARPDDGELDVVAVPCASPAALATLFMRAAVGEHTRTEGCVQARGKRIEVASDHEVPVQLDGEFAGHTPVQMDMLPMQIPFMLPPR
jgi:diacylglycerol kinase (ATP)